MSISTDVFMSILAMDSYNRRYGEGIQISGTAVGTASIGAASSTLPNSPELGASFFAQSYTWNGKTVISYRGTDDPGPDALYGWGLGLGFPEVAQADMAAPSTPATVTPANDPLFRGEAEPGPSFCARDG